MIKIRTGQAPEMLTIAQSHEGFNGRFDDPASAAQGPAIARLEAIAWQAMKEGRAEALERQRRPSRVLLICGGARNDGSCPGEISKAWRLTRIGLACRSVQLLPASRTESGRRLGDQTL